MAVPARVVAGCALVACGALLAPGASPGAGRGERVLATEDSLRTYFAPETTRVVAHRVPLSEIIRRAQEGEVHRYDGISTLAFDRIIKITLVYGDSLGEQRCIENVARVYYRAPESWAEVPLRESRYIVEPGGARKPWEKKGDDDVEITFDEGDDSARRLSDLPAYLQDTEKYDFQILHRSLRPDQVIYEIGFEPRSDFDVLPGGRVWLLTSGYQVVREEYHLKNLPFPWALKSLGLITRDWQDVGGRWLPRRITARAGLRSGIGLGIVKVPHTVEAIVLFDRYQIDPALDAALFDRRRR